MRELPSPTNEIVCEPPLYLSGAAAAPDASPVTSCRVKLTPLLHWIGKVEVSKSSYGFTQEPTEIGRVFGTLTYPHLILLYSTFHVHLASHYGGPW
jgi:hypothetical protein